MGGCRCGCGCRCGIPTLWSMQAGVFLWWPCGGLSGTCVGNVRVFGVWHGCGVRAFLCVVGGYMQRVT